MKILALTYNTFKEATRQPIFYIILISSALLIYLSPFFTFFAFHEEIKMIKDMGLATITMATLLLAFFGASSCLSDEIERKTAMTVLCKPVSREQFVLGKFIGISLSVLTAACFLALVFILALWQTGRSAEFIRFATVPVNIKGVWPGLFLIFLQAVVLTAIATAISTRCGLVLNLLLCSSVFILGNLSNYMVGFLQGRTGIVRLFGSFFYILIPNLQNFNVSSAIALNIPVPADYLLAATAYGGLYSILALLTAFLLFRRREL